MVPPHSDDVPRGRVLSRREVLASLGAAGAALLTPQGRLVAGLWLPACIVRPEQTEGPYFLDQQLDRSDIRAEPSDGAVSVGAPLRLTIHVGHLSGATCAPLPGAVVDVWQCDAHGVYSGVRDTAGRFDTTGKKFLRGHQRTGADGNAAFVTVYPGWYPGRTVHIHFKIRTNPDGARGHEFTSQLYFDDAFTDRVYARAPYAAAGQRTRNTGDGIFRRGGSDLILPVVADGDGYRGTFDIGLQL